MYASGNQSISRLACLLKYWAAEDAGIRGGATSLFGAGSAAKNSVMLSETLEVRGVDGGVRVIVRVGFEGAGWAYANWGAWGSRNDAGGVDVECVNEELERTEALDMLSGWSFSCSWLMLTKETASHGSAWWWWWWGVSGSRKHAQRRRLRRDCFVRW